MLLSFPLGGSGANEMHTFIAGKLDHALEVPTNLETFDSWRDTIVM